MPVIVNRVVVTALPEAAGGAAPNTLPACARSNGAVSADFAVVEAGCAFAGAVSPPIARALGALSAEGESTRNPSTAGCGAVNGERVGSADAGGVRGGRNRVDVCAIAEHVPTESAMANEIVRQPKIAFASGGDPRVSMKLEWVMSFPLAGGPFQDIWYRHECPQVVRRAISSKCDIGVWPHAVARAVPCRAHEHARQPAVSHTRTEFADVNVHPP